MQKGSWTVLKTIPNIQNYEQSLQLMTKQQIDLNIIEINLISLHNQNMMKWLIQSMTQYQFYLKYRYFMNHLLNAKVTETTKQEIASFSSRSDEKFVNGIDQTNGQTKEESQGQEGSNLARSKFKGRRLEIMIVLEEFNDLLAKLAEDIFKIQGDEGQMEYFQEQLTIYNSKLTAKIEEEEKQAEKLFNSQKPKNIEHQQQRGLSIIWRNKIQKIKQINISTSFYIKTKNRIPLVLDLQFGRLMYKNDDQLSHELISMQLIKYINAILGKQYIIPYQIIPLKTGAFYQFVEDSYTINSIKKEESYAGSLLKYYEKLQNQVNIHNHINNNNTNSNGNEGGESAIKSKFAETYSGFCLIQYLLDIKDRNNANIMIRNDGAIFHVDLTFIFGSGPGGISFQSAPFKMTKQYVKLLQGFESDYFKKYQALLVQHFTKLSSNRQQLQLKINILSKRNKEIKCFQSFNYKDFCKKIPNKLQKVTQHVQDLIDRSYDSFKTNKYDDYQFKSNNIEK